MKQARSVLSILLAVILLVGGVPTAVFASSEEDAPTITEIESDIDPRLPELFETEEADETQDGEHAPDDVVRIAIILDGKSAIDKGFPVASIAKDKAAAVYRGKLLCEQELVINRIENRVLDGGELDVFTNLTLVANLISANVKYSQIEEIEKLAGVKEVIIENVYEPLEDAAAGESGDIEAGDDTKKALERYTGVGSRIAVIDSGVNDEHQSFDPDALNYSLEKSAPDTNKDGKIDKGELDEYKKSLHFMTQSDVLDAVNTSMLHVLPEHQNAETLYRNDKIPFAYNYSELNNYTQNGSAGIHGSHVSGIAAANAYIPTEGDGEKSFVKAEDAGAMVGTAPDAQIINLKVFGANMCTDSVIAMAVEDALVLGADVLNLSLGVSEVGFSCSGSVYGDVFDKLSEQGVLIMGAVGNDGSWVAENKNGRPNKLYSDDVNMSLCTPPSSYADFMGVAWADGTGTDGSHPTMNKYSAYGIPSSLMLQPEITACGTDVNSVNGNTNKGYTTLSGTSMAAPDVAGAAAVAVQYISVKQDSFGGDSFFERALSQNGELKKSAVAGGLLMSSAEPMTDPDGNYYSLLRQGAGLLNTRRATEAKSFIDIEGQERGRVKAEVGDSPDGKNTFNYTFTLYNVSDTERSYVFSTDLFTEDTVNIDGTYYLADKTRALAGETAYKVGDTTLDFTNEYRADVNNDGKTDAADAQALLDFLSEKNDGAELNLEVADVDHDGEKTTHDAHLILKGLKTAAITVAANDSVRVDVEIHVTEDFEEVYPKGTYLEGFTSVIPVSMGEDEPDITHTIPILGFCGNWSDPAMFDRNSFAESFNGSNDKRPYTKNPSDVYYINYMNYQDESGNILRQTVNPYNNKVAVPSDMLAMSMKYTVRDINYTLIRPAGAICFAVMTRDGDGKRQVVKIDTLILHQTCAFPHPAGEQNGGWSRNAYSLSVRSTLEKILDGTTIGEGDTIEIGAVAAPEYYEETPGHAITKTRMKYLIENDILGEGAYLTTTVKIDSVAPTLKSADVLTLEKRLKITAEDESSVAYIGLFNSSGSVCYENYTPGMDEIGTTASHNFYYSKLQDGGIYTVVLGDLAGNRRTYRLTFGEKKDIMTDAIAYVRSYEAGAAMNRGDWVAVNPERFTFDKYTSNKMYVFDVASSGVIAGADAADNYIWQAFEDGSLCAAPLSDINDRKLICDLTAAGMGTVRDLAFNCADSMLYATDGSNTLWQIDPMRGDVKKMQTVTVSGEDVALYGLAINKDGVAFATHYSETDKKSTLLSWKIESEEAAEADRCALRDNGTGNKDITARFISLSWKDKNYDTLYAATAENLDTPNSGNYMYKIYNMDFNSESCTMYKSNHGFDYKSSYLYSAVRGLVNLPAMPTLGIIDEDTPAELEGLRIIGARSEMTQGDTTRLTVCTMPWNADVDLADIKWHSSGEETLTVDSDGLVTARKAGSVTVNVSCDAGGKTVSEEFDVKVNAAPDIDVTALFCEDNGVYYWESFNTATPNERKRLASPRTAFEVGTLNHEGDCLYLFGSTWAFRVNPEDFSESPLEAALDAHQNLHADGAPGRTTGAYTNFGYLTIGDDGRTLLLGSRLSSDAQKGFNVVTVSMHTGYTNLGTMGAIAYKDFVDGCEDLADGVKDPEKANDKYSADLYYVMNQSGDLYELYCYEAPRLYDVPFVEKQYLPHELVYSKRVGHVDGVSLPGVNKMSKDATASMIYDKKSDSLVLISKIGIQRAKVQVINPHTAELVISREFDENVRQVGVLYQYDYSEYKDIRQNSSDEASIRTYAAEDAAGADGDVQINKDEGTVSLELTADASTNGLWTLEYDSSVLTFSELSSELKYVSYHNETDGDVGVLKVAFADADVIDGISAHVVFTYKMTYSEQTASLSFKELEKGDPALSPDKASWEKEITLPALKKELLSISITGQPEKTEYLEGEKALDTRGLEVTAYYSDGSERKLEAGEYELSGYEPTPGEHEITVSFTEDGVTRTASFMVNVKKKSPQSLSVSKEPSKMKYVEGTDFEPEGMELTLTYDNGDKETVTGGWDITYSFDAVGKSVVYISYGGLQTTLEVEVIAKSPESITVSKEPDKTVYVEGTKFDPKGMELTLTYDNGDTEIVTGGWTVSYDFSEVGEAVVKISYRGCETTLTVKVIAKSPESITVSKEPDKTVYVEKTEFNDAGMELTLTYDNGEKETITGGWDITYSFDAVGKSTVYISYSGLQTTLEVEVIAKSPALLEVSKKPDKTVYVEKTEFNDAGMELTLTYDNGEKETITGGWDITYNFDAVGKSLVYISYSGLQTTLEVEVIAKSPALLEVSKKPDKTVYVEKTEFNDAGMELTLTYDNGEKETVTGGWTVDYDFAAPGQKTVVITYGEVSTTLNVTVIEKSLIAIELTALPEKVVYLEGAAALDVRGGKLRLSYDNGATEEIELTSEMIDGFDSAKPGRQTITVTYGGFNASFEITVQAKEIERIEVSKAPDKTEYIEGTEFDSDGMEITVYYDNGTSETLSEGWSVEYSFDSVGECDVTVSYEGHDTVITVNVVQKSVCKIEITKMPDNTEYTKGDEFSGDGMEITVYYDNGTSETLSEGWTAEYDFSESGERTVSITYGDVSTSLTVTVSEPEKKPDGADTSDSSDTSDTTDTGDTTDTSNTNDSGKDNGASENGEGAGGPQTGDSDILYIKLLLVLSSCSIASTAICLIAIFRKRRNFN